MGKVYRLDAESAVFDNKVIAALNVMVAQTVSYSLATIAVLSTIPAIGIPYAALTTLIVAQTAQEHLINSY